MRTDIRRDIGYGPERQCLECDWLPETEEFFYADHDHPGRFRPVCKECHRDKARKAWRAKATEKGKPPVIKNDWPKAPALSEIWK